MPPRSFFILDSCINRVFAVEVKLVAVGPTLGPFHPQAYLACHVCPTLCQGAHVGDAHARNRPGMMRPGPGTTRLVVATHNLMHGLRTGALIPHYLALRESEGLDLLCLQEDRGLAGTGAAGCELP